MEFFIENINIALFFPLWVFLLIMIGKFTGVLKSKKTILLLTLISSLWGLISSLFIFAKVYSIPDFVYETTYNFIKIRDISFDLGIYIDLISALMLLVVFAISFFVQLYSYSYMNEDRSFTRFFAFLNLFSFSMVGLILAPNLFQTYIFWELVGVTSYLLIGFWYKKVSATKAAKKAFIMNRIGDFGLLCGVIVCSVLIQNFANRPELVTLPYSELTTISGLIYSYTPDFLFVCICIMLLMGSIAKSAQFPLHTWLADAMEGPTPVSALIHSATMVAAGVFLIARLYPIYFQSPIVMKFITIIGLITAIACAFFAITAVDIKRVLAFSTNSQLGLMFVALGSGALTGGMIYLTTHAFIKATLFLCAGIVMHSLSDKLDIRYMGGLRKYLPTTAVCFFVGAIALSGMFFSGFFAKGLILFHFIETSDYITLGLFLLVSFMTAFYIFRLYFVVFEGEFRGSEIPGKSNPIFNTSIISLTVITVLLTFFLPKMQNFNIEIISVSIALSALIVAFILYHKERNLIKIPILYNLSANRFYIDDLYNFIAVKIYGTISQIATFIDKYIVDGIVSLLALLVRLKSWIFSKMQTGNIQSYLSYSFLILTILFTGFCLVYSLVVYFAEV